MNQGSITNSGASQDSSDQDEPGSSGEPEPEPPAAAQSSAKPQAFGEVAEVEVIGSEDVSIDSLWIRDRVIEALPHIARPVERICVTLVDDEGMTRLHRDHCGIAETTDVLTFPGAEPPEPIDADIAVCVDEAKRRAAERDYPIQRELLLYALHGVLHAAGYDDHEEADYLAMHAEEDRILRVIGVGPTFRSESSGHDDDRSQPTRVPRTES